MQNTATSWYAANVHCRKQNAYLVNLESSDELSFILNTVLGQRSMSFWTGLNRLDNPSTTHYRWYMSGAGFVSDYGYRGTNYDLSPSSSSDVLDAFCVSYQNEHVFGGGVSGGGLVLSACSNGANTATPVGGFICEKDAA